jgi:hypothetical protein
LVFEVFFENVQDLDEIGIEFFNRAIISGGELAYCAEDSLDVIERCRQLGKKIIGIDAFILTRNVTQPQDYADYSEYMHYLFDPSQRTRRDIVVKPDDLGHWEEAKQFVKERASKGWVFEIDYEEQPFLVLR